MPGDSPPLTVACLKWGTRYSVDYVNILHGMVSRHLSLPHRFVCLTDDPAGIACEALPIVPNLPTWWGKLTLFRHPIPGRVLFIDLDTVIVGNIDGFGSYDGPFCVVRPFYRDWGFNSSIMNIAADFGYDIWNAFARDPRAAIERCRREADPPWNLGDQRWIELTVDKADYWQDVLPGQLVSYKVHCGHGLPAGARLVCFHGKPDPQDVADPWVRQHWRISTPAQVVGGGSRA
jgi:hypothetical protein